MPELHELQCSIEPLTVSSYKYQVFLTRRQLYWRQETEGKREKVKREDLGRDNTKNSTLLQLNFPQN